jgi:predicted RNase H-like HicB family nuclease
MKLRIFSLRHYVEAALKQADFVRDEDGVVVARVPHAAGFFAQGDDRRQARENLRDVIEGNVLLALQLGLDIPHIAGVAMKERRLAKGRPRHGETQAVEAKRRRA